MRTSEWVIVAYFAYLLATGAILRVSASAMRRLAALAVSVVVLVVVLAQFGASSAASVLRDWLPGGYVLAGYWATGLLYRGPNRTLEAGLEAIDSVLCAWVRRRGLALPRPIRELLEFAYLCCYPLVPAGMAMLYLTGQRSRADFYWMVVATAAFAAYGVLPWAASRPPRATEKGPEDSRPCFFRRVNLAVLERGSIQVNTFPSGHAASAWGVALFMTGLPGALWVVFALFAGGITVGAVAGRYHYALDVVAGILVALGVFVAAGG